MVMFSMDFTVNSDYKNKSLKGLRYSVILIHAFGQADVTQLITDSS